MVVRAGALGDVLLLRPAIASLRAAGHIVRVMAPAAPAKALAASGSHAGVPLPAFDGPEVAAWLAAGDPAPGLASVLRECDRALAVTRDVTLVAALRRHVPEVVTCDPFPPGESGPAWAWYASALAPLGIPAVAPLAETPTADEVEAAAPIVRRLEAGFLALHPGSGSARKNWPVERYARLVEARASGRPWLLVLGPAEGAAPDALAHLPGVVVARELPLRTLGAALARAGLYVGNDSGVSHLAAAYGVPSIVLFGPTDPGLWAPWGPRVTALRAPGGRLDALPVEDVIEAARLLAPV